MRNFKMKAHKIPALDGMTLKLNKINFFEC